MSNQVVEFTTDKRFIRRARELKTIEAMVRLYCRGHGHPGGPPLCPECAALFEYATRRLERCVFGDAKPTCTDCLVHCYSADMRARQGRHEMGRSAHAVAPPCARILPRARRTPAGAQAAAQTGLRG